MIRLLQQSDKERTITLLDREHELNIIMINDIEKFGLENAGQTFQGDYYGAFRNDDLGGVSVIYNFGSMFIYAPDSQMAPELIEQMTGMKKTPRFLSARADWGNAVLQRLMQRGVQPAGTEEQEFMTLAKDSFEPRHDPAARFAEPRDLQGIVRLSRGFQIEYFGTQLEAMEELARMAESRMVNCGVTVLEKDGRLASKAEIMAHTDKAALLGGVYTDREYRGRDFSFACMSLLCESILGAGRTPCLNVSKQNPPARAVYKGLGFNKLCDYRMAHFS